MGNLLSIIHFVISDIFLKFYEQSKRMQRKAYKRKICVHVHFYGSKVTNGFSIFKLFFNQFANLFDLMIKFDDKCFTFYQQTTIKHL